MSAVPNPLHVVNGQRVLTDPQRAAATGVWRDLFLRTLQPEGYRYIAAFRKGKEPFTANISVENLASVEELIDRARDLDVYYGVAPRGDASGRGTRHCQALHALFIDLDFKDVPEAAARANLAAFPLPPSAVVVSGGGLHAYWFLREPFHLQNGAAPRAKAILRALASALGGDLASAEPARILRLPGTLNHKYDPPRPVVLEHIDRSRRYALDEILAALPVIPAMPLDRPAQPIQHGLTVEARVHAARRWLANQPAAIQGEGGDACTFKVCAAMVVGHDLAPEAALQALAEWNARCVPPWDEYELRRKVHNAELYATGQRGEQLRPRRLVVTLASEIKPKRVLWTWEGRLPQGELALLAGREGLGKTTAAYTLIAGLTRGRLPGACFGTPRSVIVAATEDSWEHTIVPRLMAADADLTRVARVNVEALQIGMLELSLPDDIDALEQVVREMDAALVLLDPVISRLSKKLDTHKDAEVRLALEPTARLAYATNACVLGIIHVNKGSSKDPLNTVMGSRAFVAAARAVLFVVQDPDNEKLRLLGQAKNNLGRGDLPTLGFKIESATVADTPEGPVETGKLVWTGESPRSIRSVVEEAAEGGDRTAVTEAAAWLNDHLKNAGGYAFSNEIKREGAKAGHNGKALERAKSRLGLTSHSRGFPRRTIWAQANAEVPEQMDLKETGL